jgi:hypothetical protein
MSNPNVAAKKATTKKRKKRGSDVGGATLLNQGFTITPISKYINQKIAMTDEVYAAMDRDDRVSGFDYIYWVVEESSSPSSTTAIKLKCCYENERIKANSTQSKVEPFRDGTDIDAEEYQTITLAFYKTCKARYKEHMKRIMQLTREEQAVAVVAGAVSEQTPEKSIEEKEEEYCRDLKVFVSGFGAGGKDEQGRSLLDMHWVPIENFVTPTQDGKGERKMVKRKNISTQKEVSACSAGAFWKKVDTAIKKNDKSDDWFRSR